MTVVDHAGEQRVVEVGMSTTVLDHTPRGHAGRYVQACYTGMRDDVDRTEAYRRAIVEAAPGKVVMDLGTGALALLAMYVGFYLALLCTVVFCWRCCGRQDARTVRR